MSDFVSGFLVISSPLVCRSAFKPRARCFNLEKTGVFYQVKCKESRITKLFKETYILGKFISYHNCTCLLVKMLSGVCGEFLGERFILGISQIIDSCSVLKRQKFHQGCPER